MKIKKERKIEMFVMNKQIIVKCGINRYSQEGKQFFLSFISVRNNPLFVYERVCSEKRLIVNASLFKQLVSSSTFVS